MDERSLIFPAQDFRDRQNRLQAEMAASGLDALLLTTPADVFYTTGFLTQFWESPARPWFILVPQSGDTIAIIPSIGAELMGRTWISDIRTWNAPDPKDDGVSLLTETIREVLPRHGRLGIPMGLETHFRAPLSLFAKIAEQIGTSTVHDATAPIQRTREIKSNAEIEKIRDACMIANEAFETVPQIARPGQPLDVVFREFQIALLKAGADWVSYVAGAAGPLGYTDVISPATSTTLAIGDVLMLDTGAVKDGYFCDFDRNFFLGEPAREVASVQEALWTATEDALGQLHPGMRACDVHRILSENLLSRGASPLDGRLGHGLGVSLTEWPSFTPKDTTELREGMVLTLEPSALVDDRHFLTHEENVVLRASGAELLSPRAPRHPVI